MSVRTRGLDWRAHWKTEGEQRAALDDAARILEAWNKRLAAGGPVWFAPTLGAALATGYVYLEVLCGGCQQIAMIDLRTVDRLGMLAMSSSTRGYDARGARGGRSG